jgi:predicted nicotinamide N-methyase
MMGGPVEDDTRVLEEEIEAGLVARYETELYSYYDTSDSCDSTTVSVRVRSATSTRGCNLTSDTTRDRTGVMIWPATHYLCQWITETRPFSRLGSSNTAILELGCGCGLVGLVTMMAAEAEASTSHCNFPPNRDWIWVSTDIDPKALELTRENFEINKILMDNIWIRKLSWGDYTDIQNLQAELNTQISYDRFNIIVAADIVYPSTANQVLTLLFQTIDTLLSPEGSLYLSFCTRDGYRTPQRLIAAADSAGYYISAVDYKLDDKVKSKLPPLLDAKLLVLRRGDSMLNQNLGAYNCQVFPGLQAAIQRASEEVIPEEWEPPAFVDGDDEEEFERLSTAFG